ncbi:hypothetical protein RRG08_003262, partial [Elysia crispata]
SKNLPTVLSQEMMLYMIPTHTTLARRWQATVIPTHSGQTPSYSDTDTDSSDANLQALGRRWPQSVE